jgi:hypothetical protein
MHINEVHQVHLIHKLVSDTIGTMGSLQVAGEKINYVPNRQVIHVLNISNTGTHTFLNKD